MVPSTSWEVELERWLAPFLERIGRAERRRWAPLYLKGLLLPGERKSLEPLAERVCPGEVQQLHHFLSTSPWPTEPLQEVLFEKADRLVGGCEAVLLINDTERFIQQVAELLGQDLGAGELRELLLLFDDRFVFLADAA